MLYTYGMAKTTKANVQLLKGLHAQLKAVQAELVVVQKAAGIDDYLEVKRTKNQSRLERIKKKGLADRVIGHYLLLLTITAKKDTVFVPLSIASGKKQTGFIYQIEGTGDSSIVTAKVTARGEEITLVTLGTIVYAKIPPQRTGEFNIQIQIKGKTGKVYKFLIHRINYKLAVTDARYNQYLKEIPSDTLKFS